MGIIEIVNVLDSLNWIGSVEIHRRLNGKMNLTNVKRCLKKMRNSKIDKKRYGIEFKNEKKLHWHCYLYKLKG